MSAKDWRWRRFQPPNGANWGKMLGNRAKFGHKKEQAIAALLFHKNLEAASRAIGVSANTLQRWTKDPEFEVAYQKARRVAFRESIARLQEASGAAVTTVLKIMLDSKISAGTRLRAAEVVLSQGIKAIEMEDIAARVAELERTGSSQRSRKLAEIVTLVAGPTTVPARVVAVAPPLASPTRDEQER